MANLQVSDDHDDYSTFMIQMIISLCYEPYTAGGKKLL